MNNNEDDDEPDIYMTNFEVTRGVTQQIEYRKGKKVFKEWHNTALGVRFRCKGNPENYMMYIDKKIKEIENRLELWASNTYNKIMKVVKKQ